MIFADVLSALSVTNDGAINKDSITAKRSDFKRNIINGFPLSQCGEMSCAISLSLAFSQSNGNFVTILMHFLQDEYNF